MSYDEQRYLDEHQATYAGFMKYMTYVGVGIIFVLALMAVLLV
ncbi:MAG: aa3-type cytochrome c oxidase subunit IV [Alphaproteobacteria bacterium]